MKFLKWSTRIYRGSRPSSHADMQVLWDAGVRTVISLEEGWGAIFGWPHEPEQWRAMGGVWLQVKLSSILPPTRGQLDAIYALMFAHSMGPGSVFVHCYSGVDRTGIVCAHWQAYGQHIPVQIAWENCCAQGMHRRFQLLWKRAFFREEAICNDGRSP